MIWPRFLRLSRFPRLSYPLDKEFNLTFTLITWGFFAVAACLLACVSISLLQALILADLP